MADDSSSDIGIVSAVLLRLTIIDFICSNFSVV